MRVNLTARFIATVKPGKQRIEFWDKTLAGFELRVTSNNVKTFAIMYRHGGRLRRMTIGKTPPLYLADARGLAREALRQAALGNDPAADKVAERQSGTFEELTKQYIERWAKKRKKSWKEDERIIEKYLLPRFQYVRPGDVGRSDIRVMLEALAEDTPVMANRVLACLKKIYSWAISQDLAETNPCTGIERPGVEQSRDRILDESELRKVWSAMESESNQEIAALFKIQLLTAARGGEIAAMQWAEVDWDTATWTIPSSVAKNGLAHRVPLSEPALKILRRLQRERKGQGQRRQNSPYVFPNRRHPSEPLREVHKGHQRIRVAAGVVYTPHDLRRTAVSLMTSMGVSRLVVGRILNHVESGATAIYDRHSYDREKRAALDRWASKLLRITTGLKAVEPRKA